MSFDTLARKFIRQMHPVGGHSVVRGYRSEGNGIFVSTFVAHDSHAPHRSRMVAACQYFVIQFIIAQALYENIICLRKMSSFSFETSPRTRIPMAGAGGKVWREISSSLCRGRRPTRRTSSLKGAKRLNHF